MSERPSTFQIVKNAFRRLPVSCVLILVSCFFYANTLHVALFQAGDDINAARPGSLPGLQMTEWPDIKGHFDLWRGEWWRLPVSAFHHGGPIHLIMNVMAFWLFADYVEPRLGRLRYLLFCLGAATFSFLPEIAIEVSVIGISGIVCAQFGMLLILRRHDDQLAEDLPASLVPLTFLCLILCVPLTFVFGLPIANGAHFMGLVYGALVGWLCYDLVSRNRLVGLTALLGLHIGLFGAIQILTQPVWNGRYFAWRAINYTRSLEDWKRAVELDPGLEVAWRQIIQHHLDSEEPHQAWVTAMQAARKNRSTQVYDEIARQVWQLFDTAIERAVALDELEQVFRGEHQAWIDRFELPLPGSMAESQLAELDVPDLPPQVTVRLDQLLDVPENVAGITSVFPPEHPPGRVDPDHPHSAVLGELL